MELRSENGKNGNHKCQSALLNATVTLCKESYIAFLYSEKNKLDHFLIQPLQYYQPSDKHPQFLGITIREGIQTETLDALIKRKIVVPDLVKIVVNFEPTNQHPYPMLMAKAIRDKIHTRVTFGASIDTKKMEDSRQATTLSLFIMKDD